MDLLEKYEFQKSFTLSSPDRYSGFKALWVRVIVRAIYDWVGYRDSKKLEELKKAENAYTWLFEPNLLFNGLENICGFLDISPKDVRERARRLTKDQIAKIEHLERAGNSLNLKSHLHIIAGADNLRSKKNHRVYPRKV